RAVVAVLARLGYEIKIWNRTHARAVELASLYNTPTLQHSNTRLAGFSLQSEIVAVPEPDTTGCDLVVNCTSASKNNHELPIIWQSPTLQHSNTSTLQTANRKLQTAIDLFYSPHLTPFLQQAKEHGWQTTDGVPMLIHQAAAAWKYWGIKETPDTRLMEDAARAALKANA